MNSKRKATRKWYGIFIAIIIFAFVGNVVITEAKEDDAGVNPYSQSVENQTAEFYVNDFANLFTEEQKNSIIEKATQLEEETGGIQVVISTVDTWGEGRTGESYTHAMYNQYEIGEKSMGVLITFSKEEGEILFETGKNMQIFITDSQIDDLLDGVMEVLRSGQIAEGLMLLQDSVIEEIRMSVPEDWHDQFTVSSIKSENSTAPEKPSNNSVLISMLLILIIALVILVIIACRLKLKLDSSELEKNKLKRKKERLETELENLKQDAKLSLECAEEKAKKKEESLNRNILAKESRIGILETQYEILSEWYERAKALYPKLDSEIEIMIENEFKDKAGEVDQKIQKCINLPANPCHIESFQNAINSFEALDDNAKRYINSDIKRLYELLEKSINMKSEQEREEAKEVAVEANNRIKSIMDKCSVGSIETYEDLMEAFRIYDGLTKLQKSVFPDVGRIRNLQSLISDAEQDCKDVEATNNAMEKVRYAISDITSADENDLDKLERAYKVYKSLSERQQSYFDYDLLNRLKKLIGQAEEDRDREERRRRERSYNNDIMYGSLSHNHSPMNTPPHRSSGYSHNSTRPSGGSSVKKSSSISSTSHRTGSSSSTSHRTGSSSSTSHRTSSSSSSRPMSSHKATKGRGGKGSGNTIKRKI